MRAMQCDARAIAPFCGLGILSHSKSFSISQTTSLCPKRVDSKVRLLVVIATLRSFIQECSPLAIGE
jgi:hypothetical protein